MPSLACLDQWHFILNSATLPLLLKSMKIKQTCKCETIWKQIKNDENEEIQSQISISEFALPRLLYRVCSPESAPPSLLPRVSLGGHANANGFIQTAKCSLFSFKLRNRTSAYVFHVLITLIMKKSMIASKRLRDFVNLHKTRGSPNP